MAEKVPLLLVPGLVSTRLMWEMQVKGLSDIADCWVTPLPAADDIKAMAEEILANAPAHFALAGHSMGGYICFEILRLAPHRVLGLGLFCTSAAADSRWLSERRYEMMRDAETEGFLPMIRDAAPKFVVGNQRGREVIEMMVKQAFEVGQAAFCKHQMAAMGRTGYDEDLARISCPTLILGGKKDIVTRPSTLRRLARAIPNAEFHAIDDAAHMITMENAAHTNRQMRQWLVGRELAMAA